MGNPKISESVQNKLRRHAVEALRCRGRAKSHEDKIGAILGAGLPFGAGNLLASELGLSAQFLCDLRKGRRGFSPETLTKLSKLSIVSTE